MIPLQNAKAVKLSRRPLERKNTGRPELRISTGPQNLDELFVFGALAVDKLLGCKISFRQGFETQDAVTWSHKVRDSLNHAKVRYVPRQILLLWLKP